MTTPKADLPGTIFSWPAPWVGLVLVLALTLTWCPEHATAASAGVELHRRMQLGRKPDASGRGGATKVGANVTSAPKRRVLQDDEPEDPIASPTARKGWVYEYHTSRDSGADHMGTYSEAGGLDGCAKACAKKIGCVAFQHGNFGSFQCNGCNCVHYAKVASQSSYHVNFFSGYRKKVIPPDFKPTKGIIVDNTTGIAAIYNDMLNENAPGTCQLEVNCGGRSLAADDAGNGTATNGTTAGNGTAIGHADIVNGAINGTATCGSNVLNTTQLPSQDSCAYLAVQFDASPAGEAGMDSAETQTVQDCCKACLASSKNCTAFTFLPPSLDDDFQVGACSMFSGARPPTRVPAGSGIVSGVVFATHV